MHVFIHMLNTHIYRYVYIYMYIYIYDIPYESDVFHLQKGTRYSQLSWDEMTSLSPKPLEVILETG